ncbi:hypothetical protein XENOCAPTIV_014977 [Xenoophorus captivus]|uniref:Uncharacterized protein n=1 Tax=Xenoophorus captivus TaxID=1517983 RepID=A0ABV0RJE3_9TELE
MQKHTSGSKWLDCAITKGITSAPGPSMISFSREHEAIFHKLLQEKVFHKADRDYRTASETGTPNLHSHTGRLKSKFGSLFFLCQHNQTCGHCWSSPQRAKEQDQHWLAPGDTY